MKEYVYGFPTPDLMDKADSGEIILAGCTTDLFEPTHYCVDCQEQYPQFYDMDIHTESYQWA
jgi:hypothetical protein